MDFAKIFEQIDTTADAKAEDDVKALVKGDGTFLKLKKLAKKSADNVPEVIDYVYKKYNEDIEALAKKHRLKYEEVANMFIAA